MKTTPPETKRPSTLSLKLTTLKVLTGPEVTSVVGGDWESPMA